jgi:hypothetical protein
MGLHYWSGAQDLRAQSDSGLDPRNREFFKTKAARGRLTRRITQPSGFACAQELEKRPSGVLRSRRAKQV